MCHQLDRNERPQLVVMQFSNWRYSHQGVGGGVPWPSFCKTLFHSAMWIGRAMPPWNGEVRQAHCPTRFSVIPFLLPALCPRPNLATHLLPQPTLAPSPLSMASYRDGRRRLWISGWHLPNRPHVSGISNHIAVLTAKTPALVFLLECCLLCLAYVRG